MDGVPPETCGSAEPPRGGRYNLRSLFFLRHAVSGPSNLPCANSSWIFYMLLQLAIKGLGRFDNPVSGIEGFWGASTSSVDWCELNYVWTPYIAEFFNTVSSIAMVLVGFGGYYNHRKMLEPRFQTAFLSIGLVGFGSAAFHATLLREMQVLDELPMLWAALSGVYFVMELEYYPHRRFGRWFPVSLLVLAILTSLFVILTHGLLQFIFFQINFNTAQFFLFYKFYCLYKTEKQRYASEPSPRILRVLQLFKAAALCYVVAMAAWVVDLKFCPIMQEHIPQFIGIPNPQFHAVWHVLVSIGAYIFFLLAAHRRMEIIHVSTGKKTDTISQPVGVHMGLHIMPYLDYV